MIGSKRAGSKAFSALGVLEELKGRVAKELALGATAGAQGEINWNALKAARDFEAARQKFDVEKYRAILRRY